MLWFRKARARRRLLNAIDHLAVAYKSIEFSRDFDARWANIEARWLLLGLIRSDFPI